MRKATLYWSPILGWGRRRKLAARTENVNFKGRSKYCICVKFQSDAASKFWV